KWYKTIIALFLLLFGSAVLLPSEWGWTRTLGPIVVISLGFCFWSWVGSYIYLYSRIWYTPFIPILFTYVFLLTEPFNNNHSIRTLSYQVDERPTIREHLQHWLKQKFELGKNDSLPTHVFIVSAEGGGVRSAYWASGVLAWLENKTNNRFHENVIAVSGVSGGSVGLAFFSNGLNTLLHNRNCKELSQKLGATSSFDFLSDLNRGLVFNDVVQKICPLPINALDRAQKLEDAFSQSFSENFGGKMSIDKGLCATYAEYKQPFNPCLIFNTTHVETGRKAIVSNCRIGPKNQFFYDVIDLLDKAGQDVPIKCAVSMSSRFPFVTPPALIERKNGDSWGHVVDGGYFENSGLHSTWQICMELSSVIEEEIAGSESLSYKRFLQQLSVKVVYLKNSLTLKEEDVRPMKIEELAPANAFINAWGRKTVTDIKHFENNISDACFYLIKLHRYEDDGIPLGWYLSNDACSQIKNQLNKLDTIGDVQDLLKTLSVLK
ncbi:MAG: patatin-like phospholipase family protein, partial [Flavobacteriales bacterium]